MSYKYAVINNKPVGYWPMVFDTPSNSFKNYASQSNPAIPASGSTEVITDIAPLISRHAGDNDFHSCRVFSGTDIEILNSYNFAINGFENKNFSIEAWVLLEKSSQSKMSLLTLQDSLLQKSFELYILQDNLYLKIFGSTEYIIKKQIRNVFAKNHVYLSFENGTFNLSINGISEESISLSKEFNFANISQSKFHIGPSSATDSYVISDIAFYDRVLSFQEIRSHMFWATQDSDPSLTTIQGSTYSFNITSSSNLIAFRKDFNNEFLFSQGSYNGLIYKDGGLTVDTPNVSSGSWTYNFTPATYDDSKGLAISWDTGALESSYLNSNFVNVSVSFDQGINFYSVKNNELIRPYISQVSDMSSAIVFVKVELSDNASNQKYPARIDNLSIKLYRSLEIPSESGGFSITPSANGYNLRKDDYNLIARSKNFGIHFNGSGEDFPSSAVISSTSLSDYKSIEFWFKYNGSGGGAVIDTPDIPGDDIYIDIVSKEFKWNLGALDKIYINGIEQSTQGYPVIEGEPYHFFIVYSAARTSDIHLNKSLGNITSESNCVFGYISIYPSPISSLEVENRYISFLTVNSVVLNDQTNSFGSLIEYSGTSSSLNSGFTVMAYDHIY